MRENGRIHIATIYIERQEGLSSKEQRRKLKREYGEFYEALVQLLAEYDLIGLVKMGAPKDEYEPEVDVILGRLNEASSPDALRQIIYEAFVQCFSLSDEALVVGVKAQLEVIGSVAWNSWRRWQREKGSEY